MKTKNVKRLLSFALAIAMVVSLFPTVALAGDTLPYQGESALADNEPTSHGYRAEDLLAWDPATDPDAELLRARVPLQNRIDAVAATQAKPELNPEVEYLTLAGDYGNAFFGGTSYTNEFSEYCFNFWQYIDYYGPWHGQTTATTPFELWDSEGERKGTSDWQKRAFEFGMMNLPNAAYTNAAHKNGVLSLGCIFLPRAYQSWRTLIQRDENGGFPYADKLIEITNYYGFDGWFVNLEGSDSPSGTAKQELAAFLKYLREEGGLYIQYYNAGGSIDQQMMDSGAADSFFKDYGWGTSGAKSEVAKYGMGAVHGGFEAGGNRWNNNFSKMWSDGQVVCSIASLGTDFVHAGLDEDCGTYLDLRRETDDFQWMSAIRERMWFTGSSGNPTDASTSSNNEVGVKNNKMPGIASMVTERSVINGDTFYTNFNTGHGLVYAVDGVVSNTHEWANISIQDVLPTWQFWFETNGTALKGEFDYGTNYKKALNGYWNAGEKVADFTYGEFDFDLVNPYNGGSSLAIYGAMDADNFMHLYKTNLDVKESTKLDITFKKTSSDNVAMSLGVVLAKDIDAETNTYTVTELAIENTTAASEDWVTATVDLSQFAGESIAMIGLYFKGESEDYQMHIGQMKYTSGAAKTPAAPTGLTIDKAYDTNEMVVSWDFNENYEEVQQYNVYAVINGVEMFMGGIYDEIYYIKNIYDAAGEVTIKVTAVGADGSESEAATATYDYSKAVTDLAVEAADGSLTVSFTPADATVATDVSVYVPATKATYTATAAAGETSVVVTVPTGAGADGKEYEMQVTPVGGFAKAYDGELDDSYCVPYDGPMTGHALTSPVACTDWYKLALSYTTRGGQSGSTEYTRGVKSHGELNHDWSRFQALPSDIMTLEVTLTDYDGNVSEPKTYNFDDKGEPIIPEEFHRIFFLDAGRKYFSVENVKKMIDAMAEANMNELQFYFSDNQGFRLALDDMTLTTEFGTYDLTNSLGDGYSDGDKNPDGSGKYLTQSEMDEIIAYANANGIKVCPSLNVPGHMGAILEEFESLRYPGSKSSIDLTSDEAKAFAKALIEKYATYFESKGCEYFSFGADEYANDLSTMGFENIYNNGIYKEHFVPFFNDVAAIIKSHNMIPRAFNDGVMYKSDATVEMDKDVQINYWSSGWNGYNLAPATFLNEQGFDLINTNQSHYWVLGKPDWQPTVNSAANFDITVFDGSVVYNPIGAMLCVWCDRGATNGQDDGADVAEKIAPIIKAFGGALPEFQSTEPLIDASIFPDAALRQAVISQVGPYVSDLKDFTGTLNLTNTNVTDLTGIAEYLPGVTGLNLTGTGVTKITSDMLPEGLQTLNLTNCTSLVLVELNEHPDLVVDFTGCTAIENLYLAGTNMTEINISAMTKLHNFIISNSQISKITAASASTYTNAYYWNWTGSKLDLSASTKEGKLKDGMEAYFATADLEEEVDPQESVLLNMGSVYGKTTIDMALPKYSIITKLFYKNDYDAGWGIDAGTIYVSEDGVNYTQVAEFSGVALNEEKTIELPEGTRGQYVRLVVTTGRGYGYNMAVWGCGTAPMGFAYNAQKPALVRDELSDVIFERNGQQHQLLDILTANYASFKTVRGTPVADLEGETWVDANYLATTTVMPDGVKVNITDEEGNVYIPSNVEPPELGALDEETNRGPGVTILGQSGQYSGEESKNLFDGNTSNKWCCSGATGWMAFMLPESSVVGKWYTVHAFGEMDTYITSAFSLQILNEDVLTEADFLGMSSSEQSNVMRNNSYWIDLDAVTGNSDRYVTRTIEGENLREAQVYRLYISKSVQESFGTAVRINELELYTYSGKLKVNTNGIFVADQIGTWNVSYTKAGTELANINVRVRLSDQDLVDLSQQVEAAKNDAEAAKTAAEEAKTAAEEAANTAEEAQAKAEEAQAAAEAAAAEAAAAKEAAEAAAAESAENKEAAEAAQAKAEEAQAKAEAAQAAAEAAQAEADAAKEEAKTAATAAEAAQAKAEEAQAAAEDAAEAAEQSNQEAAAEAAQAAASAKEAAESEKAAAAEAAAAAESAKTAAEEAAASAASAQEAAASAAAAADAQAKAQAAQAAAEEAAQVAEEAKQKAEEAKQKAEEAAASSAEDKENAEKAAQEAEEARIAAEKAQKAAEDAQAAAETAKAAAEEANREAAASAAQAAEYAKQIAETYAEIVKIKAELVDYLAQAQQAAEDAEEAKKAAEEERKAAEAAALKAAKYYALIELVNIDTTNATTSQAEAIEAILAAAREAIDNAETTEAVEAALAAAKQAIEDVLNTVCAADVFTDVNANEWYHESIDFMYNNGYMVGKSATEFGVRANLTRGQMVAILYRIAGAPSVEGLENKYTDLETGAYYYDAILWATEQGIVYGNTDGTFRPEEAITREQMVAILYRYAGAEKVEENKLEGFQDADKVSSYAVEAMNWAVAEGVVSGVEIKDGAVILDATGTATRAQFASVMHRYLSK